jgi:4-carboxymuconolactone decarboxylase
MSEQPPKPPTHRALLEEFPAVGEAYEQLGFAAHQAGPLDRRTRELVKLALAIGARYEGAVHAHTRLALAAGATPSEIKHVVALAITTLGMPTAGAAYTWVNDILTGHEAGS